MKLYCVLGSAGRDCKHYISTFTPWKGECDRKTVRGQITANALSHTTEDIEKARCHEYEPKVKPTAEGVVNDLPTIRELKDDRARERRFAYDRVLHIIDNCQAALAEIKKPLENAQWEALEDVRKAMLVCRGRLPRGEKEEEKASWKSPVVMDFLTRKVKREGMIAKDSRAYAYKRVLELIAARCRGLSNVCVSTSVAAREMQEVHVIMERWLKEEKDG